MKIKLEFYWNNGCVELWDVYTDTLIYQMM